MLLLNQNYQIKVTYDKQEERSKHEMEDTGLNNAWYEGNGKRRIVIRNHTRLTGD